MFIHSLYTYIHVFRAFIIFSRVGKQTNTNIDSLQKELNISVEKMFNEIITLLEE